MSSKISVQYILGALFCIFALVPWVNFGINDLDSQPWPLLSGGLFLLSCSPVIKAPLHSMAVFFLISVGFLFSALASESFGGFTALRAAMNYLAILTAYIAFYNYLNRYGFPWRIFISVNIIWLIMAGVELVVPEVTETIAKRRTTADRGVTSLAPEPTFFAIYLFFSSWLMLAACAFRPDWRLVLLLATNVAATILLAKSTMGVLFIVISAGAFVWYRLATLRLSRRGLRWLIMGIVAIAAMSVFGREAIEGTRIDKIYSYLAETSVWQIIMWDASINQRLEAVVMSLHGALYHNLWPAGLDTYLQTRDEIIHGYDGLFWWLSSNNKIMSWIGAIVYELGFFGIAALALLAVVSYGRTRKSRVSLALLGIILLSAVPPSFPLVPMLLALMAAQKRSASVAASSHQVLRSALRRESPPGPSFLRAPSKTNEVRRRH